MRKKRREALFWLEQITRCAPGMKSRQSEKGFTRQIKAQVRLCDYRATGGGRIEAVKTTGASGGVGSAEITGPRSLTTYVVTHNGCVSTATWAEAQS